MACSSSLPLFIVPGKSKTDETGKVRLYRAKREQDLKQVFAIIGTKPDCFRLQIVSGANKSDRFALRSHQD